MSDSWPRNDPFELIVPSNIDVDFSRGPYQPIIPYGLYVAEILSKYTPPEIDYEDSPGFFRRLWRWFWNWLEKPFAICEYAISERAT